MKNCKGIFKILLFFIIFFISFSEVKAETSINCSTPRKYTGNGEGKQIDMTISFTSYGGDNTSQKNIANAGYETGGGAFFDASSNSKIAEEQLKLNKNGEGTLSFYATAVSGHYISGIDVKIVDNGKTLTVGDDGFAIFGGCGIFAENKGSISLNLSVNAIGYTDSDNVVITIKGSTGTNSGCAVANKFNVINMCAELKDFALDLDLKGFQAAANAKTQEEQALAVSDNSNVNTTTTKKSAVVNIPKKTTITSLNVSNSQKIECDDSLEKFISKIWKYIMILSPILLIVMITLDFLKAILSSDQELIKKASNNAIRRTLAALILLCLPLILSTILGFFGLKLCI